eukprot:1365424-Alexandrium_andersonii.AAC.1
MASRALCSRRASLLALFSSLRWRFLSFLLSCTPCRTWPGGRRSPTLDCPHRPRLAGRGQGARGPLWAQ